MGVLIANRKISFTSLNQTPSTNYEEKIEESTPALSDSEIDINQESTFQAEPAPYSVGTVIASNLWQIFQNISSGAYDYWQALSPNPAEEVDQPIPDNSSPMTPQFVDEERYENTSQLEEWASIDTLSQEQIY